LRAELENMGYQIVETFGSTSGTPGKRLGPPNPFIISIIEGDIEEIKSIIRICKEHGLEGIERGPREPGIDLSDVYIGSYSYISSPYVLLTDDLIKQIDSAASNWDQLKDIVAKPNRKPAQ